MKVALIQCPGWGRECPPFALACLAAYVRREGHEAFCFDLNNAFFHHIPDFRRMWEDKDYYSFWENRSHISDLMLKCGDRVDEYVDRILATGAPIVGFTTHTTSYLVSLEVARRIKRKDPSRIVIFGGPQCSRAQAGRGFAEEDCVDAVAVGEGEATLLAVLETVARDGRLRPMPGLILRWEGKIVDCGDRELIADLDSLPFPDYSDFRDDILDGAYDNPRRLEIFDSRGCVRTCHFCSEWQFWKVFRSMSGDRMFGEIRRQMQLYPRVDRFYFVGSLANGSMKTIGRFCDLVIESGLKVEWEIQAIINPGMDEAMLKKMADAGCRWIGYGVETGSEALRYRMNKKFTNENAYTTLAATHKAGIKAQINIMFGQPTETREDFEDTLRFLTRVRPHVDSVLASQSFTVIDKSTIFYDKPELFGIKGEEHHLFWDSNEGANDYPERFRRYEEFCRLALSLGLPETAGVLSEKPDKWLLLGNYHEYKGRWTRAIRCYRRSLRRESVNKAVLARLARCYREARRTARARACLEAALKLTPPGVVDPVDDSLRRELESLPSSDGKSALPRRMRRIAVDFVNRIALLRNPRPPFRLGYILNPFYLSRRVRELRSPARILFAAADLPLFVAGRCENAYHALRGVPGLLKDRGLNAYHELRGLPGLLGARGRNACYELQGWPGLLKARGRNAYYELKGWPGLLNARGRNAYYELRGWPRLLAARGRNAYYELRGWPGLLAARGRNAYYKLRGWPGLLAARGRNAYYKLRGWPGLLAARGRNAYYKLRGWPGLLAARGRNAFYELRGLPGFIKDRAWAVYYELRGLPAWVQDRILK